VCVCVGRGSEHVDMAAEGGRSTCRSSSTSSSSRRSASIFSSLVTSVGSRSVDFDAISVGSDDMAADAAASGIGGSSSSSTPAPAAPPTPTLGVAPETLFCSWRVPAKWSMLVRMSSE